MSKVNIKIVRSRQGNCFNSRLCKVRLTLFRLRPSLHRPGRFGTALVRTKSTVDNVKSMGQDRVITHLLQGEDLVEYFSVHSAFYSSHALWLSERTAYHECGAALDW